MEAYGTKDKKTHYLEVVTRLWRVCLDNPNIQADDNVFQAGADSLMAVSFVLEMERETGKRVPIGEIFTNPTPAKIALRFCEFQEDDLHPSFYTFNKEGSLPPLVFVPPSLGGIFHYKDLIKRITPKQPVYALEPKISASGKHSYTSIEHMAWYMTNTILSRIPDNPVKLCGYSFGGTIAWEVAKQIKARGREVDLLILLDPSAESLESESWVVRDKGRIRKWISIAKQVQHQVSLFKHFGLNLNFQEILLALLKEPFVQIKRRFESKDTEIALFAQIQFAFKKEYNYGFYSGDVYLFRAARQTNLRRTLNATIGWNGRVNGRLEVIPIPGNHGEVTKNPTAVHIADRLNSIFLQRGKIDCSEDSKLQIPSPLSWSEPSEDDSIIDRFQEVVQQLGNKLCIEDNGKVVTYKELEQFSSHVADRLITTQKDASEPVAVMLDNGWRYLAAILGCLKVGRIYIPLESTLPRKRIELIVQLSKATHVITDKKGQSVMQSLHGHQKIEVILFDSINLKNPVPKIEKLYSSESPAVLLFTSGSTDVPKGVLHTHRSLNHMIWRRSRSYKLTWKDRYIMMYSGLFMGCISGVFTALLSGASLHYFPIKELGVESLENWLRERHITVYHSVTTILRRFMKCLNKQIDLPDLRIVNPGGEASRPEDIVNFRRLFPETVTYMANLASTECGPLAFNPINHETRLPQGPIPVGLPFKALNIKLLDELGDEVPVGQKGEIVVQSPFIFSGYWEAKSTSKPGTRSSSFKNGSFYTGDFGRRNESGMLVNLGRKDSMVKINGNRIELQDVESSLNKLEEVAEGVVTFRKIYSDDEEPRLVAFYKPASNDVTNELVRSGIARSIPQSIVPSRFVALKEMPVTPNEKIDRKILETMTLEELESEHRSSLEDL